MENVKTLKEDGHRKKKILKNIVNSPRQNSNLNFPKQDKKKKLNQNSTDGEEEEKKPHISKTKIIEIKTHLSLNM